MKRTSLITCTAVFLFLMINFCIAQSKKDLLAKKWNYKGIEEFGVVRPPDSTMKSDLIELKADGTFNWMKQGKKISGTWTLNEKAGTIGFTNDQTKKTQAYNLKSVDEKQLVIEYQTPDLVRTRYRYEVAKE